MTEKIVVGTLGNRKHVEVETGTTIREALRQGGFTPEENHSVKDMDSRTHDLDEEVESGTAYFLIPKVKNAGL